MSAQVFVWRTSIYRHPRALSSRTGARRRLLARLPVGGIGTPEKRCQTPESRTGDDEKVIRKIQQGHAEAAAACEKTRRRSPVEDGLAGDGDGLPGTCQENA